MEKMTNTTKPNERTKMINPNPIKTWGTLPSGAPEEQAVPASNETPVELLCQVKKKVKIQEVERLSMGEHNKKIWTRTC